MNNDEKENIGHLHPSGVPIHAGDVIVFTVGDYSDYRIWYVAVAEKDFTWEEVDASIPRTPKAKRRRYAIEVWVLIAGYVREISYHERELG